MDPAKPDFEVVVLVRIAVETELASKFAVEGCVRCGGSTPRLLCTRSSSTFTVRAPGLGVIPPTDGAVGVKPFFIDAMSGLKAQAVDVRGVATLGRLKRRRDLIAGGIWTSIVSW